jgi:hypothetical protein
MASVTGKIIDGSNKLQNDVLVAIKSADTPHPDIAASTNDDGIYQLENLGKGNYVIVASKEGFQENESKLFVANDNKEYVLNFILRRKTTIATDKKKQL